MEDLQSISEDTKTVIPINEKTGYDFLEEMCQIRNPSTAAGQILPMSPRVIYILEQLNEMGLKYQLVPFSPSWHGTKTTNFPNLVNIYVKFDAIVENQDQESVVFLAHHDVANTDSENCQDNTASVCNLLHLCNKLRQDNNLQKDVYIVFTDCEEIGGRGAERLGRQIVAGDFGKVNYCVNLELTACGDQIWAESIGGGFFNRTITESNLKNIIKENFNDRVIFKGCPYNDSIELRRFNIDSICFGILPSEELRFGYPKTWALCHRVEDTFELSAHKEDMNNFVDFLNEIAHLE